MHAITGTCENGTRDKTEAVESIANSLHVLLNCSLPNDCDQRDIACASSQTLVGISNVVMKIYSLQSLLFIATRARLAFQLQAAR